MKYSEDCYPCKQLKLPFQVSNFPFFQFMHGILQLKLPDNFGITY
jgi:hypothetical protein